MQCLKLAGPHLLKVWPVQVLSPRWKMTALPYVSMATPDSWPSEAAVSAVGQDRSTVRPEEGSALGCRGPRGGG